MRLYYLDQNRAASNGKGLSDLVNSLHEEKNDVVIQLLQDGSVIMHSKDNHKLVEYVVNDDKLRDDLKRCIEKLPPDALALPSSKDDFEGPVKAEIARHRMAALPYTLLKNPSSAMLDEKKKDAEDGKCILFVANDDTMQRTVYLRHENQLQRYLLDNKNDRYFLGGLRAYFSPRTKPDEQNAEKASIAYDLVERITTHKFSSEGTEQRPAVASTGPGFFAAPPQPPKTKVESQPPKTEVGKVRRL